MLTVGKFKPPPITQSPGSANSPYYYGSGGYQPKPPSMASPAPPRVGTDYVPPGSFGAAPPQVGGADPNPDAGYGTVYGPGTSQQGGAFGGGGTPDYTSLIGGSWEVAAAEAMMASQMAAARQSFQTDLRQGFIDLGYDKPVSGEGIGDFSKYIDKDTIQKAIDNKYSAYAQIKQQETKANAVNSAMLASSGLGTSGTVTETASDTLGQVEQARYEGLRNFLGQGRSGLEQLASLKSQLAASVMNARFAAAQRLAAMYQYGSGGGSGGGYTNAGDVNYGFEMPGGGNISNLDYVTQSENEMASLPPPAAFGVPNWNTPTVRPSTPSSVPKNSPYYYSSGGRYGGR